MNTHCPNELVGGGSWVEQDVSVWSRRDLKEPPGVTGGGNHLLVLNGVGEAEEVNLTLLHDHQSGGGGRTWVMERHSAAWLATHTCPSSCGLQEQQF